MSAGFVSPESLARDERSGDGVICYAVGLTRASVCAPSSLAVEDVLAAVNERWPTGLDHGWAVDESPKFNDELPNPCPCEKNSDRVHRLLVC